MLKLRFPSPSRVTILLWCPGCKNSALTHGSAPLRGDIDDLRGVELLHLQLFVREDRQGKGGLLAGLDGSGDNDELLVGGGIKLEVLGDCKRQGEINARECEQN
jgi:hypothetical protein